MPLKLFQKKSKRCQRKSWMLKLQLSFLRTKLKYIIVLSILQTIYFSKLLSMVSCIHVLCLLFFKRISYTNWISFSFFIKKYLTYFTSYCYRHHHLIIIPNDNNNNNNDTIIIPSPSHHPARGVPGGGGRPLRTVRWVLCERHLGKRREAHEDNWNLFRAN